MHGTFKKPHGEAAIDFSQIEWEIVVIEDPTPSLVTHYRVISSDGSTGTIIGTFVVPAGPNGAPPRITLSDVIGSVGNYRIASIYVEIEARRLVGLSRRASDRKRRRDRGWLRKAFRPGSSPEAPQ